jgi:hypothetical protein
MIEHVVKAEFLWSTPTLTVELENVKEFNQRLAQIILDKEREIISKGKPTTVAGLTEGLTTHWLEYNVLNWEYPETVKFRHFVLSGLREFLKLVGDPDDPALKISGISCWANILRYGEGLEIHHHDPAFVSMHYHVQCDSQSDDQHSRKGERENAGNTVYFRPGFFDRSHGGEAAGLTSPWDSDWRLSVKPVEGRLFFFPSYVRHEVRPNLGKNERISIALDAYVKKQEALIYFAPPRWFVPENVAH